MSRHLSIAYQLYSAREDMANDVEGTLAQVAGMGYRGVEFAGFFERSAKDINKLMKKTGLTPVSSHVPLQQIRENMRRVVEFHEDIGCKYIAVPYLTENDRPGAPGFACFKRCTPSAGYAKNTISPCFTTIMILSLSSLAAGRGLIFCSTPFRPTCCKQKSIPVG